MTYNLYDKQTNIHIPSELTFDRLFYRFKGIFISRPSQTSSHVFKIIMMSQSIYIFVTISHTNLHLS